MKKHYSPRLAQGLGLGQQLKKLIQEECDYLEYVLERVIAVIRTLAGRG